MSFGQADNKTAALDKPLWQQYRDQFPVTERLIYLNHAAVAPLPKRSAEAMKSLANDALDYGSLHYDQWMDTYEALRIAAARLIGAARGEIAIVKNTSEGIATIAMGMDWRPTDRIVAFKEEFPANYFPWLRLEAQRCSVEWLSIHDPLHAIERATYGAKLLAISFVQYLGGLRVDLTRSAKSAAGTVVSSSWMRSKAWALFRSMCKPRISMPWPQTGTNGCWVQRVAAFCMCARTVRTPFFRENSAGRTWPAITTTHRAI